MSETKTQDKPAEFFSDWHKNAQVAALVREQEGYEAKAAGLEKKGDGEAAKYYKGRASEVGEELKRLGADAKTPRARAETR